MTIFRTRRRMTEAMEKNGRNGGAGESGRGPAFGAWRKALAGVVSFGLLAAIYWRIDLHALWHSLSGASLAWVLVAIAALVPALALTAWRLCVIVRPHGRLPFAEAAKLILLAHSLNMVLPSRLGDFIKAHAMTLPGAVPGRAALSVVIIEKTWDALAVMLWCAVGLATVSRDDLDVRGAAVAVVVITALGLLIVSSRRFARVVFALIRTLAPGRLVPGIDEMESVWNGTIEAFWRDRKRAAQVIGATIAIWFIHLVEIWLFIVAVGVEVPFMAHLGLAPLVMMASLIPLTLSGIGTRDAAIIVLYRPFMDAATAAALGLIVILRYLVPAIAGLPYVSRYLASFRLRG